VRREQLVGLVRQNDLASPGLESIAHDGVAPPDRLDGVDRLTHEECCGLVYVGVSELVSPVLVHVEVIGYGSAKERQRSGSCCMHFDLDSVGEAKEERRGRPAAFVTVPPDDHGLNALSEQVIGVDRLGTHRSRLPSYVHLAQVSISARRPLGICTHNDGYNDVDGD
jgi:hypothetical protein